MLRSKITWKIFMPICYLKNKFFFYIQLSSQRFMKLEGSSESMIQRYFTNEGWSGVPNVIYIWDSLEGLMELSIQLYLWLKLITAPVVRIYGKIIKQKDAAEWGRIVCKLLKLPLMRGYTNSILSPAINMQQHVCKCFFKGNQLGIWYPKF